MKKFLVLLLGFCFAVPAFAGTIGAVSNEAWLDHVSQMQSLRQQIMALVTKSNSTVEDRQNLELLNLTFAEKKAEWEQYLESVAQGKQTETEVKKADEPAKVEKVDEKAGKKGWARYNKHGRKNKKHGKHVCKADCSKHKKYDEVKKACEQKCKEMCKETCKGLCKEECKGLSKEECEEKCKKMGCGQQGDMKCPAMSMVKACMAKCKEVCKTDCKGLCDEELKKIISEKMPQVFRFAKKHGKMHKMCGKAKAGCKDAACADKAKKECCSGKGDKCCKKTGKGCADKAKAGCKDEVKKACTDKAKTGCCSNKGDKCCKKTGKGCADKAKADCKKACTDKK